MMLESTKFVSFCNMRTQSFQPLPPRSITPPVEVVPASAEVVPASVDPTPSLSNMWTTWSARTENTDTVPNPTSGVNPSPLANDPWIIDEEDTWASNDARAGKLEDSSKSLTEAPQYLLISLQVQSLG